SRNDWSPHVHPARHHHRPHACRRGGSPCPWLVGRRGPAGRDGIGPGRNLADGLDARVRGRVAAGAAAVGAGVPHTVPYLGEKVPPSGQSFPLPRTSRFPMTLRKHPAARPAALRSGTALPWLALSLASAIAVAVAGCHSNAQEAAHMPTPPAGSVDTVLIKPEQQLHTFSVRVSVYETVEL